MVLVAGAVVGLAVLYTFDPSAGGFYPRCWWYTMTGWQCPGCGGLRAAHSMLHGRLGDAFRFNPLLVILLPMAASFMIGRLVWRGRWIDPLPGFRISPWLWLLGGITLVFGVVRNLI